MSAMACAPAVIAIGASAGGVAALRDLLSALPADLPVPVLVVQHLPADRPSLLAPVLGERCALPVIEAQDKAGLRSGEVVLAPPGYHLLLDDRYTIALSADPPVLFSRPAIDPLFESVAGVFGKSALAILLTGASQDGSEGLRAVRAAGGHAWVQDPADAAVPLMPASALDRAGADAVLTLEQMRHRLAEWPR